VRISGRTVGLADELCVKRVVDRHADQRRIERISAMTTTMMFS
jgi:hypothetical protein